MRTNEELQRLSRRLLHDVQVFFHVQRTLTRAQVRLGPSFPWAVQTALVESFALHARGLTEFFFTRKASTKFPDNAVALHFFGPSVWSNKFMPPQGPWLSKVKLGHRDPALHVDRFGKEIGHLTFEPDVDDPYLKGWPVVQVAMEVGAVVEAFVGAVDDSKVTADFKPKALREVPMAARIEGALAPGIWTRPVSVQRGETEP